MPERQQLVEARPRLLAEATSTPGRYRIQLINPGWGSSGYYSPEVLTEAVGRGVFSEGLHMYADHPTESDRVERPERSVRDLWGVLTGGAEVDENGTVFAEAMVFAPYRPLVDEMREAIGLSIRAAGQFELGEAEGRSGRIITSIDEAASVDFVTSAGRGGRILQLVESARGEALTEGTARAQLAEARNVGQWIESRLHLSLTQIADEMFGDGRLTREERIALSSAVGDGLQAFTASLEASQPQLYTRDLWDDPGALAAIESRRRLAEAGMKDSDKSRALRDAVRDAHGTGDRTYAWVQDFDDTLVYFQVESPTGSGLFQQGYTFDAAGVASLTDTPDEVVVKTLYVPVNNPAGQSTTTESQGGTMPEIEEARLRQLEEAAGRVQTLESERDTALRALAEARARSAATDRARVRIAEANANLAPATVDRIVSAATATVPLTDAGQLDEAAFDTRVDEARTAEETYLASLAESGGSGRVTGFGQSSTGVEITEADIDKAIADVFGRTVKEA